MLQHRGALFADKGKERIFLPTPLPFLERATGLGHVPTDMRKTAAAAHHTLGQGDLGRGRAPCVLLGKAIRRAAGILLPFGYGQGTGQALNYGNIYETQYGFIGGKNFGLTIAALGFLSASIGGVFHLHLMKRKGKVFVRSEKVTDRQTVEEIQSSAEIPMNGSMDKLTVQIGFIFIAYILAYLIMFGLGKLVPGMIAVIYGFNFLLGVLFATRTGVPFYLNDFFAF